MTSDDQAPDTLLERLAQLSLFEDCPVEELKNIVRQSGWISLPAGQLLIEQGAHSKTLYILLSGRLSVVLNYGEASERRLSELGPGETVGEMGVITGAPRSASVVALRDSELLRIPDDLILPFLEQNPQILLRLFGRVAQRVSHMTSDRDNSRRPRSIALIPLDTDSDWPAEAQRLAEAGGKQGYAFRLFQPGDSLSGADGLEAAERAHDLVLLLADQTGEAEGSAWRTLCLRQADRIVFLVSAKSGGRQASPLPPHLHRDRRRSDLVVREQPGTKRPTPAKTWHAALSQADWVHRLRPDEEEDYARLARHLLDRARCLVLSGGGARGFAHLGVIRALREAGEPIDLLAGTSMGAMVAAACALEWDEPTITYNFSQAFVKGRPTSDFTLPLVALLSGRRVSKLLKTFFTDRQAEDLWRPFYSVATDLTNGVPALQSRGPLWRNLRASAAIPGLLPPVQDGGRFLGDGGVLANLPVEFLLSPKRGPIMAVDIARDPVLQASEEEVLDLEQPFWRLWPLIRAKKAPSMVSILLRAGTIGSERNGEGRDQIDLLISPPLQEIGLLDWKAFERAREIGYQEAKRVLMERDSPPAP